MSDREALSAIYQAIAPKLLRRLATGYSYTTKAGETRSVRVASAFEREEILQEAFRRFAEQWHGGNFDRTRAPEPYIMRIAFFTTLQTLNKQSREIPDEQVEIRWAEDQPTIEPVDARLERSEKFAQVRAFLESVTEEDRRLFVLRFEEDLSQAKIAERIGASRDQVQRALVRMRGRLAEFFEEKGWLREP